MMRGALVAVLVASLIVSFAVVWTTTVRGTGFGPHPFKGSDLPDLLLFRASGEAPAAWSFVWPGMLYLVGAALVGCLTGAVAVKLKGTVRRRTLILIGISPLGPWLLAAAVVAIPPLSDFEKGDAVRAAGWLIMSLPLALPYTVVLAPLVAPPVVLGNLMLEGWTRPPGLPATGFARPSVRHAVLMVLLGTVAAFTTFALLQARR